MREFTRNVALLGYYVDKYNETKKNEFVIAAFLKLKAVLNYGDNMAYSRHEEDRKTVMNAKNTILKGIDLIRSKVGSVYKYSDELLNIFIDNICNMKYIQYHSDSFISIRTSVNGLFNVTNALASVILEPLDELKMLNDDVYPIDAQTEILRYLAILTYNVGLDDENVRTFPERMINKFKEFTYRYTASIIEEVKDNEAIKKVLLDKHSMVHEDVSSIYDLLLKAECMDKDYNVTKKVKDDNLSELKEMLTEYIEYNTKVGELSDKYMSIMKDFPDALCEEFYLDTSNSGYNELQELWLNTIFFVNIEALEKMKDILDKAVSTYNIYYDVLREYK